MDVHVEVARVLVVLLLVLHVQKAWHRPRLWTDPTGAKADAAGQSRERRLEHLDDLDDFL